MRKNRSLTTATGLVIPALKSLPIAALLLAGMTACSDDDMPGGNETPDVSESLVTVGNDPSAQAHRITFYGKPVTRAMSRAAADFPSVGSVPQIPEGCPSFDSPNDGDQSRKESYILTGGSGQIALYGGNVYIKGDVTTHNISGQGTIYVMPDASLTLSEGFNNSTAAKIVAHGNLNTKGHVTIGNDGQVLVKNSLHVKGDLAVGGTVVVNGALDVDGKIQFNNSNGRVKGKCITVNKEGDRAVDMSGGGELAIRSHLFCEGLYMGDNAQVYLWPNAMAKVVGTTKMTSYTSRFSYYSSEGKKDIHCLLNTGFLKVEGGAENPESIGSMFGGNLKAKFTGSVKCENPANEGKFIASADDYYIPSDVDKGGCNSGNGKPEDKPFDPISFIEGPEHEHNHLSATCIQPVGSLAYVSFHLNEAYKDNEENYVPTSRHMGCVEVYDVNENKAEISSWLMNQDFDFNHLLVDGDKLYTTGDTKKYGATLGVVELNGGKFGQHEMGSNSREDVMTYYNLYNKTMENRGSSGNCIIRDGNFFRIASYQGFQSFNVSDLTTQTDFIATTGSAKHIAQGGGYIVTLNLDQKGEGVTSSPATVTVYNTWGTSITTFKTGEVITPINGKNVIAVNGQNIYVALGEKGVAKYDMNGALEGKYSWIDEKLETSPEYKGKPLANGLAVDENYVYVANGEAGMIVLDKKTMERIARYSRNSYSANYVQKVGDLIYIAYGRNGLEVVKMREH